MTQTELQSLWERVGRSLHEWYDGAVGWTGEKARIGVKKMDILGIQHSIRRLMTQLGGRVYDLVQHGVDVESDPQVQAWIADLRRLEGELAEREREIAVLRGSRPHVPGARQERRAHDAPSFLDTPPSQ